MLQLRKGSRGVRRFDLGERQISESLWSWLVCVARRSYLVRDDWAGVLEHRRRQENCGPEALSHQCQREDKEGGRIGHPRPSIVQHSSRGRVRAGSSTRRRGLETKDGRCFWLVGATAAGTHGRRGGASGTVAEGNQEKGAVRWYRAKECVLALWGEATAGGVGEGNDEGDGLGGGRRR
jgi:hypothetical protein